MTELDISTISNVRTNFPLINSVIEGKQEGRAFGLNSSANIFIIHKADFSYFIQGDSTDYDAWLYFIHNSGLLPIYFHIYDASPDLIGSAQKTSQTFNIRIRNRIQLQIEADGKFNRIKNDNFHVEPISNNNFEALSVFHLDLESKFWRSKQDFLTNGLGSIVYENKAPQSICYTACVAAGKAEVDVATREGSQRKGLAKLAVSHFLEQCQQHQLIVNWDCFEDNLGSLKTAESLGFKYVRGYTFLSLFNKSKITHESK